MRILIAALLLCAGAAAQPVNPPPAILKGSPPGGAGAACSASAMIGYLANTGVIYACPAGSPVWTAVGGSGSTPGGVNSQSGDYTLAAGDCSGKLIVMTGASKTFSFQSNPSSSCYFTLMAFDATPLMIARPAGHLLNGAPSSMTLPQYQSIACSTNGTDWWCPPPVIAGTGIASTQTTVGQVISLAAGSATPPYVTVAGNIYGPVSIMTPPTGAFGWLNQNGSVLTGINGSFALDIVPTSGSDNLTCYMSNDLPAAGADYTADVGVWGYPFNLGIALSDGTKIIVYYLSSGGTGVFQKWNTPSSVSGNYFSGAAAFLVPVMWVRYRQSGSTRSMFVSVDGVNWISPGSSANQTKNDFLTETKVGVCQETNAAFNQQVSWVSLKITQQ